MKLHNNNFTQPLCISLKQSNIIAIGIALLHLIVATILFVATSFPLYIVIIIAIFLIMSYIYYYRWHVSLSLDKSIANIKVNPLGEWSLINSNKKAIKVTLQASSFVSQYILLLNFSTENGKKYTALIDKSMISLNEYRYLKVRLKTS